MFPLSTPLNAGLGVDLASAAIVFGGLLAFVAGAWDLRARVWGSRAAAFPLDRDVVAVGAYAALGLVGLAVLVMIAGGRGIPVAQAAFLACAVRGVWTMAISAPALWRRARSAPPVRWLPPLAFAAAACWSVVFWARVLEDHVALPHVEDGIAHAVYYLRILQAGVPTLGRVGIGFADIFGAQTFVFYPTGTHALMAIASGFWGQWGIVSHAGILKAWFTLAAAAAPFALYWFARRLMPRLPWWIGLSLVFVAMPGFRFPVEVIHEGGASRLIAHVLMTPLYADALAGRFNRWPRQPLAAVLLGLAFLMHPSALVTLGALIVYAAVCGSIHEAGWRIRLTGFATTGAALVIGAAAVYGLTKWNQADIVATHAGQPFSWTALEWRLRDAWTTLFGLNYGMRGPKQWAILAGLLLLVVGRRSFGIRWRVVWLPWWMGLVAAAAASALVVPLPGFRPLGAAFYDEAPRVIEILYEVVGLCVAASLWFVWRLAAGRGIASLSPARSRVAIAAAVMLVLGGLGYQVARTGWVYRHIAFFDAQFRTPRISRLQALGAWIRSNTEPDAVVFHLPLDSEVWEPWADRQSSFMHGECRAIRDARLKNGEPSCESRAAFVTARVDVLRASLQKPAPLQPCLAEVDRFGRPAYFLVPSTATMAARSPVCADATYVTTLDGYTVVAYRRR